MIQILPLTQLSPERFETPAILKKLTLASRKLAELCRRHPDQNGPDSSPD
ncbi:MAG: hypothetical protein K8R55_00175 [Desulfuromonadaceae bacterium]|nr:hypothetical protein [Desulfuromonadaceae bacterium]